MTMISRRAPLLLCWMTAAPLPVFAHGGDDHGGKPAAGPAARPPSAGGAGDLFEVLVKSQHAPAGTPVEIRVFVADVATNAPIADADVELTITAGQEIKVVPKSTASPGIYLASVIFPKDGDLDVVASVTRGDELDLVALGALHAGPAPTAPEPAHAHGSSPGKPVLLAAGGIVGLVLLAGLGRKLVVARRRPHEDVPHA